MICTQVSLIVPYAKGADATYIAVASEVLEQLDLPKGALGQNLLAEDIGYLFDGNALPRLDIRSGTRVNNIRQCLCSIYAVYLL